MSTLQIAIEIATKAHKGQTDKANKPYIEHPLRVMNNCNTNEEKIYAILHDVIEDTDITLNDLEEYGFSNEILEALSLLTKTKEDNYFDYVTRISKNKIARVVKYNDLLDNSNLSRLNEVTDVDLKRVEKYKKALTIIEEGINKNL